jgi:4,5-epoxidase
MTRLVFADGPLSRFVRDRIFVPLLNRRLVQRLIAERASQLKVSYRAGPLAHAGGVAWRGVRPGDRVPDLDCLRADGARTRLHAELGPRWALLGPSAAGPSAAGLTDAGLTDAGLTDAVRSRLGDDAVVPLRPITAIGSAADRSVLLVRPDAHLAWRGREPAGLRRWLATALGSPAGVVQPG